MIQYTSLPNPIPLDVDDDAVGWWVPYEALRYILNPKKWLWEIKIGWHGSKLLTNLFYSVQDGNQRRLRLLNQDCSPEGEYTTI